MIRNLLILLCSISIFSSGCKKFELGEKKYEIGFEVVTNQPQMISTLEYNLSGEVIKQDPGKYILKKGIFIYSIDLNNGYLNSDTANIIGSSTKKEISFPGSSIDFSTKILLDSNLTYYFRAYAETGVEKKMGLLKMIPK